MSDEENDKLRHMNGEIEFLKKIQNLKQKGKGVSDQVYKMKLLEEENEAQKNQHRHSTDYKQLLSENQQIKDELSKLKLSKITKERQSRNEGMNVQSQSKEGGETVTMLTSNDPCDNQSDDKSMTNKKELSQASPFGSYSENNKKATYSENNGKSDRDLKLATTPAKHKRVNTHIDRSMDDNVANASYKKYTKELFIKNIKPEIVFPSKIMGGNGDDKKVYAKQSYTSKNYFNNQKKEYDFSKGAGKYNGQRPPSKSQILKESDGHQSHRDIVYLPKISSKAKPRVQSEHRKDGRLSMPNNYKSGEYKLDYNYKSGEYKSDQEDIDEKVPRDDKDIHKGKQAKKQHMYKPVGKPLPKPVSKSIKMDSGSLAGVKAHGQKEVLFKQNLRLKEFTERLNKIKAELL